MSAVQLASVCFDEAVIAAGLSNKEIALTCGLSSDSLVSRWRSVEARDLPSLLHLHALGEDFLRLWMRGYRRRYGWNRKALLDVVEGLGELAEAVNE